MAKKNATDIMMTRVLNDLFPKKESRLEAALANIVEKCTMSPKEKLEYAKELQDLFPDMSSEKIAEYAGIQMK